VTIKNLFMFVVLSILIFPMDAYAYLDAGTGSVVIQGIIGAIFAGAYLIKLYWHQLLTFIGLRKKEAKDRPPSI
jgi:hypothetical protein